MTFVVVAVVVVAVIALVAVLVIKRRSPDDIASFRRQIDALSPEARRPTIDRMKPPEEPSTGEDGADGT